MNSQGKTEEEEERGSRGEQILPELASLALTGPFVQNTTIAPRSLSTLILATGFEESSKRPVLVPFVETVIRGITQREASEKGEIPEELEPIFERTLPLENALWLAFDLLRDIRMAASQLQMMVSGSVALEPTRLEHARIFTGLARDEAERCLQVLEALTQMTEEAEAVDAPDSTPDES